MCVSTTINQAVLIAGFLTDYFDMASKIIHDHNGIIDKFLGDGILAFFGFYNDDEIHSALDAIKSALEIRQNFKTINEKWLEDASKHFDHKNIGIDVKCGIHTGSVLFGLLDTGSRSQITIIGSTVNLASRLESIAKDDQIIISGEVKDLIHDRYEISSIELPPDKRIQSFQDIDIVYQIRQI
jgi:class 3 adenylate cyclase